MVKDMEDFPDPVPIHRAACWQRKPGRQPGQEGHLGECANGPN